MVVLWVGTNNYQHTAEQVAGGILAIAELLHSCLPKAKIIVLVSHFESSCRSVLDSCFTCFFCLYRSFRHIQLLYLGDVQSD